MLEGEGWGVGSGRQREGRKLMKLRNYAGAVGYLSPGGSPRPQAEEEPRQGDLLLAIAQKSKGWAQGSLGWDGEETSPRVIWKGSGSVGWMG